MEIEVLGYAKTRLQLTEEIVQLKRRIVELESVRERRKNDSDYFNERLDEEVARSNRYKYEFSILLVKMDNIELFSNKYGAGGAAEILDMLEAAINDTLRVTDLKCKLEEHKYGAILPYTDSEGGRIAAKKLAQAVERIFSLKSRTSNVKLTLSSGVASYPKNAVNAEQLMATGKEALTQAIEGGGNCVCLAGEPEESRKLETGKRTKLLHNDSFVRALEDEVNRCSRYSQQFSLALLAITSLETKELQLDGTIKTEIIRAAFRLLNTRIRAVDISYLYTDSRFAVILPQTGHEGAVALAGKLVHSLTANPVLRNNGVDINISINIGVASFPIDAVSSEGLLRRTEVALSEAIKNGANRIEVASSLIKSPIRDATGINDIIARLKETGPAGIYSLLAAVDVTEHYERPHSHFVARYSMVTGAVLGLSANTIRRLRVTALLHDLGKVCLPDDVLIKPGTLSDQEWDVMMKHPQYAADILKRFPDFEFCCTPVLAHHERIDGKGYPRGLKGDEIPIESRIIAVTEAYDDMVTPRPYRQQVSSEEAIQELINQSGRQFDTAIVKAFIKALHSMQSKV